MSRQQNSSRGKSNVVGAKPNETLWLFAEFADAANDATPTEATPNKQDAPPPEQALEATAADPLHAAQLLARKMPYLPRRKGERERAGHAIFQLLLASLHREDRAA